ncbi:hypothetical protein ABC810_09255 [Streptococcus pneumoniae]
MVLSPFIRSYGNWLVSGRFDLVLSI